MKVEPGPPETPRDYAQEIVYQAWETGSREKRIALAHKALEAFPRPINI